VSQRDSLSTPANAATGESHPIRDVGKIDVTVFTDSCALYGIIIASPARGDIESQKRLIEKLEAYIGDFYSPSIGARYGAPSQDTCRITVAIHPDSDPVLFDLLEKCKLWVEENHIAFDVRTDVFEIPWQ
jgi:hypothetical protein